MLRKRPVVTACMIMLMIGKMYAQSGSTEDRIAQLEKALQQLAEQNAKLTEEVQSLKQQVQTTVSNNATKSVLMDDARATTKGKTANNAGSTHATPEKDPTELIWNWDNGMEFETVDGTTAKGEFGGRFHFDLSGYDEDADVEALVGDMNGGTEFRRLRISAEGEFDPFLYKTDIDFAGNDVVLKDTYAGLKDLPYVGELRIGHMKEPFSMEEMGSSKHMPYVERSSVNSAFVPSRNNGLQLSNTALDDRLVWQAGWFVGTDNTNIDEMDGNQHVTGRVFGVPYQDEVNGKPTHWHVGIAGSYGNTKDGTARHRARPEGHLAPRLVDTGHFASDHYYLAGVETAFAHGPYGIQAEYIQNRSDLMGGGHADLGGYYVFASWFLTGESRIDAYKPRLGFYDRIRPKNDFSPANGGWGAWELFIRYSDLDLNDGGIMGGEMDIWTAGLNWYLSPSVRAIFNYGIANVQRVDSTGILRDGSVDIAQFRFSVNF